LVEFYLDFADPGSYLASGRLEEICARRGASLDWRAVRLPAPPQRPEAEARYEEIDLRRWAERLDVPLKSPERAPVDSRAAALGSILARAEGLGADYCRRVLHVCWAEGGAISDTETLTGIAAALGLDPQRFRQSLGSAEAAEALNRQSDAAAGLGVFRTPAFVTAGQLFIGHDRLFMFEEAIEPASASTPFNRWFGMRRVRHDKGSAEYELMITPSLLNRRGVAHGGAVTSLLDTALGAAVVTGLEPEEWCATLQLSIQFREPVRPGRIAGRGRMVKRGRHAAFAEGEITDEAGRLLAVASGTWYIWPRRPL
jgi:uncharacterized protein (TIGR00369 family)